MDAADSGTSGLRGEPPVTAPWARLARTAVLRAARRAGDWGRRPPAQHLLAFAAYLAAFVIAAGLPLARHLNVPNLRQYWTDVQFYTWSLRWWPYAVSHWTNPLFSAQIGAPHGYDLAWASTAPAVDLAMWPVTAAFGAVVAYNVMLLLVPPLSGLATFAAARRLTGRFWPSLAAGAVYAFCPYELTHTWQGQPNLTMIALFPLLVYLALRWWDGSLSTASFVGWTALALALEFYTFDEGFFELTPVLAGVVAIGFLVARRVDRPDVARLAGLTAMAYAGAVVASAPYLVYALRHSHASFSRQRPGFSLPLIRLVVPASSQVFGVASLAGYSGRIGRTGIDNYVGIPLLLILVLLAGLTWRRSRLGRLLLFGFAFVIALAVGPDLAVTGIKHTYPVPWRGLWALPIARSAEPSRFIVFGVLILALALALWLAAPLGHTPYRTGHRPYRMGHWPYRAARWGLGLLAVAAILTDSPTAYQAISPLPSNYKAPATMHAVNQLPPFITQGMYRRVLHPGEIVVILTHRGNAGMLFQAATDFYFRIAGGYINASLTPVNAIPHPITLLANPSRKAFGLFDAYLRSSGVGAIVVEQAWEEPWMNLSRLGMHGISVGGVTVYPMGPWLVAQAPVHPALCAATSARC
ncbi:hypothetical protein EAS64_28010 [Trebonia kvetii]|uniref:YfhO family protein n=1 Tax=Trebonia kvetii TaxID=2480626 RepID=A0A6P2BUH7_9ACTN|nr:hypothetical protein [Trebonia kvetii]TVZ02620.1 hypothetical protein EAS64_28010 [Trebonia kvetii]